MSSQYAVCTFYHFFSNKDPLSAKEDILQLARPLQVEGIMILAEEGINATITAPDLESLERFKVELQRYLSQVITNFKDTWSPTRPFRRLMIKIRSEIVTIGLPSMPELVPSNHHLSPKEWDEVLEGKSGEYVLIDTRNWYEYQLGSFKGALNPNIEKFTEFPKYFEEQNIDPDKKILIFCTGGIRCEKGIYELQNRGYNQVYQLDGGIINYLKARPNSQFEGECFVFDHRVSLDQNLVPTTRYHLCPHCGQPGDVPLQCERCDSHEVICSSCAEKEVESKTCSKNCAYHYRRNPSKKGRRQRVREGVSCLCSYES